MLKSAAGHRVTKEQAEFLINTLGTHRKIAEINYFCVEILTLGGGYQSNSKTEASDEIDALETILDELEIKNETPARILIRPFDENNRTFKLVNGLRIYK